MEEQFIPYDQAKELKKLGFNEPCFGLYNQIKELCYPQLNYPEWKSFVGQDSVIPAPTYGQAFKWFSKKHHWHMTIKIDDRSMYFYDMISNIIGRHDRAIQRKFSLTPEEAELNCLIKLIEITKEKLGQEQK